MLLSNQHRYKSKWSLIKETVAVYKVEMLPKTTGGQWKNAGF